MWIGVRFLTAARKPDGRNTCRCRRVSFLTIRDDPIPWIVVFWDCPCIVLNGFGIKAENNVLLLRLAAAGRVWQDPNNHVYALTGHLTTRSAKAENWHRFCH